MPFIPFMGGPIGGPILDENSRLLAPPVIRAEKINSETGDVASVRLDDDPIDAQVVRALTVVRRTGAMVSEDGHRLNDATKLDPKSIALLRSEVKTALARLVSNGDVEALLVQIDTRDTLQTGGLDDFAEVTVQYRNLRARDKSPRTANVRVPLRGTP